jgi:hypothetical protein
VIPAQLDLFGSVSARHPVVSGPGFQCLGMLLPADFCQASAAVQVTNRALCLLGSAAALSLCCSPSTGACSGGIWLWAFQNPATGHGEPWGLCSAHEWMLCRCPHCHIPTSPHSPLCLSCVRQEFEPHPEEVTV